jgi:hypothetical protein
MTLSNNVPFSETGARIDPRIHRKLAIELFTHVWNLLEKADRTALEEDEMIHAAHASRFHWSLAGDARNFAIGEWQVSHVYAVLGRAEPATHHARRNLELCLEHGIGDFVLAYAYEALARAASIGGRMDECEAHREKAREASTRITDEAIRRRLDDDLTSIA